jgi:hypothetical protein
MTSQQGSVIGFGIIMLSGAIVTASYSLSALLAYLGGVVCTMAASAIIGGTGALDDNSGGYDDPTR